MEQSQVWLRGWRLSYCVCLRSLQEERFAKLVAPYEGLGGPKFAEEIENLAILKDVGVYGNRGRRKHFDRLRIDDPISVKPFGRPAVKRS